MNVTKPDKLLGFWVMDVAKPYKLFGFSVRGCHQTLLIYRGTVFAPGKQKQEKERGERGRVFYWLSLFDFLLVAGEPEVGPPLQITKN